MSDFTPEQVDRAAEALWAIARVHGSSYSKSWEALHECAQRRYRREALTVLSAAGAPENVAPVVDEAVLAEVLYDTWNFELGEHVIPYMDDRARAKVAREVAAYLRGESK